MQLLWDPNWEEAKENLTRWWHRDGLAVGMWGATKGVHVLGLFAGVEEVERVLNDVEGFR